MRLCLDVFILYDVALISFDGVMCLTNSDDLKMYVMDRIRVYKHFYSSFEISYVYSVRSIWLL